MSQRPRERPAGPLVLETARLRLRSLASDEAEALHRIYGEPETMRYIGTTGRPIADLDGSRRAIATLREREAEHGFGLWAVDERAGDPLVAVAGLLMVDGTGPEVEAAYLVRRDRWGRGYATEALLAVLDAGHTVFGLPRIIALAYPENDASRRVMEKAGMQADGEVEAYGRRMTRHVSVR